MCGNIFSRWVSFLIERRTSVNYIVHDCCGSETQEHKVGCLTTIFKCLSSYKISGVSHYCILYYNLYKFHYQEPSNPVPAWQLGSFEIVATYLTKAEAIVLKRKFFKEEKNRRKTSKPWYTFNYAR